MIRNPAETKIIVKKIDDEFGEDEYYSLASIPFDLLYVLEQSLQNSLQLGNLLGYPIINLRIRIQSGSYSMKRTN